MFKNVGSADRILRIFSAVILSVLIFTGTLTGTAAILVGVLAAILLVTGLIGTCPIYLALKISTNRKIEKV